VLKAYSSTPHNQNRRLTTRSRKRAILGQELANDGTLIADAPLLFAGSNNLHRNR